MKNEHEQMVDDCEQRDERLLDWDRRFLDSISRQLTQGRSLSRKQAEALENVWERATARG